MLDTLLDTLTSAIVRRKRLNCLGFSVVRGAMLDTFSLSLSLRQLKNVCKPKVCGRFWFQGVCSCRAPGLGGQGA